MLSYSQCGRRENLITNSDKYPMMALNLLNQTTKCVIVVNQMKTFKPLDQCSNTKHLHAFNNKPNPIDLCINICINIINSSRTT